MSKRKAIDVDIEKDRVDLIHLMDNLIPKEIKTMLIVDDYCSIDYEIKTVVTSLEYTQSEISDAD